MFRYKGVGEVSLLTYAASTQMASYLPVILKLYLNAISSN